MTEWPTSDLTDFPTGLSRLHAKAIHAGWQLRTCRSGPYEVTVKGAGDREERTETIYMSTLRGVRGTGVDRERFVAVYENRSPAYGYWWTAEHSAVDRGTRLGTKTTRSGKDATTTTVALEDPATDRVITWRTERKLPVRVGVKELTGLVASDHPGREDTADDD